MLLLLLQQVVKHPHVTNPLGVIFAIVVHFTLIVVPAILFIWIVRVLFTKSTFSFLFRDEKPEPPPHNNDYEWAEKQKPR